MIRRLDLITKYLRYKYPIGGVHFDRLAVTVVTSRLIPVIKITAIIKSNK